MAYGSGVYGAGVYGVDAGSSFTYPTQPAPRAPWTFIVGAWNVAPAIELPTITGRSITWRLQGNSEAAFTVDGRRPEAAAVQELISDLWVFRGTDSLFRGRVGASTDTVTADAHTVSFSAADYRAWLNRQLLYDTDVAYPFSEATDDQIVELLAYRMHNRTGGMTVLHRIVTGTPNTVSPVTFQAGQPIGEAIASMGNAYPGFDWDVSTISYPGYIGPPFVDLYYPTRGTDRGAVIDYPGRIQSFTRNADPGLFANTIRASGGTPPGGSVAPTPVTVTETGIATDPAGRWDAEASDPSLITQAALTSYANRQLADRQNITPAWTVVLNPNTWGGPADMWLGDPVTLSVQSGRLSVVESLRIFEIKLDLDDASDTETVTLTLGAVNTDRRWKLRHVDRRLTALERR